MYTLNNKNQDERRIAGVILIELMITISLSLLLLITLLHLYVISLHSLHIQTALYNMQHQARETITILRESIHQAGYIGCAKLTPLFPIQNDFPYSINAETKLQASNQAITVRHAEVATVSLNQDMQDEHYLQTTLQHRYKVGEILMISNCQHADIFQVKNVWVTRRTQRILSLHPLKHRYKKFDEVSRFRMDTLFVEKNRYHISALFLRDIHNQKMQIINGIEDLHFSFVMNQQGILHRLQQEQVEDWSKVEGVAVTFLTISKPYKKRWYAYFKM